MKSLLIIKKSIFSSEDAIHLKRKGAYNSDMENRLTENLLKAAAAAAVLLFAVLAEAGELSVYPAPEGMKASAIYSVKANGQPVFVYEFPNPDAHDPRFVGVMSRPRKPCEAFHIAYFDFEGGADVEVERLDGKPIERSDIRPLRSGVKASLKGSKASFRLEKPSSLSVEFDGDAVDALMLFTNPIEREKPAPGPGVHYFGPGLHDCTAPEKRILKLKDGESVYIAGGAVVRSLVIDYDGKEGARIYGRGILTSNVVTATPPASFTQLASVIFSTGDKLQIDDVIMAVNMGKWRNVHQNSKGLAIRNMRTVSHNPNDDGLSLINCKDSLIDGYFSRTLDDSLVIKAMDVEMKKRFAGRAYSFIGKYVPGGDSGNLVIRNCVFFNTGWGNGVEIGVETIGGTLKNVLFENCDVIHSWGQPWLSQQQGAIGIHIGGDTDVSDIRYVNFTVEDVSGNHGLVGAKIYKHLYSHKRPRGTLANVLFKNVRYLGAELPGVSFQGADDAHAITGLLFDNLELCGKPVANPLGPEFHFPAYVRDIRFTASPGLSWSSQPGWKIRAQINEREAYYAIDGDFKTSWSGKDRKSFESEIQWLALDLSSGPAGKGRSQPLDSLAFFVSGQDAFPAAPKLFVSDDLQSWGEPVPYERELKTQDGKPSAVVLRFKPQTGKFVKVEAASPEDGATWEVYEIEASNAGTPVSLEFPPIQEAAK